ncbi:MAG TPA: PD-(D/E)XK nuclease family protein [Verrucomicrobiae bacterium]|nr:PD-(D/E)XK nuclease family protein [Verrucomicrobiae bacterium]
MSKKILLVGPASSGKTHLLLEEFEKALVESRDPLASDLFFILPSAEHTERVISLLLQKDIPGFFHRRVTTFSRLLSGLFEGGDETTATSVTRYLILKEIFEKEKGGVFEEVKSSPGFLNLMMSFISELKESVIPPAAFRRKIDALKKFEPDLGPKYEALASLYEAYQAGLAARGLRDPHDSLAVYLERKAAGQIRRPRLRKVWLDGFFDFSELQAAFLNELSEMADEITVTLTLDPAQERWDLFEGVRGTEETLLKMGFERVEMKAPALARLSGALGYAEKNLFSLAKPAAKMKPSKEITVYEAVGIEGEVEMIARTIQHMQKQGGFRFSDFAILMRHIGEYEGVIRSVFSRYGIPVEIHERERTKFSPLVQVIARLVRIFSDGWKAADLLEFLKSAYVLRLGEEEKKYEWAGQLEHAALAAGAFRGREAWLAPWGLADFDADKQKKLKALADTEDALRNARSYAELRRALVCAVEKTFGIFQSSDRAEEHVRRDAASYARFLSLLEEIEGSLRLPEGEAVVPFEAFAERFFRLVDLDLYSLHDRDRNRVQVYNISLARQKEYQVVFIAGLLEKKFPRQIREDPVLSDWERRLFNGLEGEGRLKERLQSQAMEKYLFYVAMTRARYRLFLTYPKLDLEGKEAMPSYYVREVHSLFEEDLRVYKQSLSRPYPALQDAVNTRELEMAVLGDLWVPARDASEHEPLLLYLTNEFLRDDRAAGRIKKALYEVKNELTEEAIRSLDAFRAFRTSASRLEEYAKCSFKYYAHQVLKLNDPEENERAAVRGKILHYVLEHSVKEWAANPRQPREQKKKHALKMLQQALREHPYIFEKKYQFELEYAALGEILELFIDEELERLEASPLVPRYFEHGFGDQEKGPLPPLEIQAGDKTILVRGQIDRVDVNEDRKAAAVIDYKTAAAFSRAALDLGTSLQLPLYALVLERLMGLRLAGAELYSLKKREKSGFYLEEFRELFPELGSKRPFVMSREAYEKFLEKTQDFIRRLSADMDAMKIAVKPRECADYCPYPSVCRIQKWKLPLILEEIKKETAPAEAVKTGTAAVPKEKNAESQRPKTKNR